ncbi:fungal-specific transcription factor domain-containing protein [Penicillium chermesinum]|nr:fungal-specific transcription factor domain-containing protein [Penicillium chermesinum]
MPRAAPTKIACGLCHERRVKCDRTSYSPCTQCQIARIPCELIASRRGRYDLTTKAKCLYLFADTESCHFQMFPDQRLPPTSQATEACATNAVARSEEESQHKQTEIPSLLPTRVGEKIPYMVDSSNINYLIREFGHPSRLLTDAGSQSIEEYLHEALTGRLDQTTVHSIKSRRFGLIDRLRDQGAFDVPAEGIRAALLETFFQTSFSYFPILDRSDFTKRANEGPASHLLLNAIFMVATIYCADSLVTEAGFDSRFTASLTFYHRAKDIYDAGYETDVITVIQSTFLLSHWWSGPLEQKDPWYWLGIAVGMAQAHGMHQCTPASTLVTGKSGEGYGGSSTCVQKFSMNRSPTDLCLGSGHLHVDVP